MRKRLPIFDERVKEHTNGTSASVMEPEVYSGNVAVVSLGCSKNTVDSELMLGALVQRGFRIVADPANADLIVINTCAFIESAVEEGVDTILEMARHKEDGRCRKLVVVGCMVERYREDLVLELPEVDQFVSTDEILNIGKEQETTKECFDAARRPYFIYDETMPRVVAPGAHCAYVKISEGCNRTCTFCIIPKIRGTLRSRPVESVVGEVSSLVESGIRELNFVAQDLTAYGTDFTHRKGSCGELSVLLKDLSNALGQRDDFWLRLYYAYPIGTTTELVQQILDTPFICNYLDIPFQHISASVLKRMQRPLGEQKTRQLIEGLRTNSPQLALRTTFLVGFPGETEEDVQVLEDFVKEGHFVHVGVFTYSTERESKSASFPDAIDEALKTERRERIMLAQQEVVRKRLESFTGKTLKVLLDRKDECFYTGRCEWQGPEDDGEILITDVSEDLLSSVSSDSGEQVMLGRFAEVEIVDVAGYDLVGNLVRYL